MATIESGMVVDGRYELKGLLGRGSFGEVWRAFDQVTGRDVAIKLYMSLDPNGIAEFQREYQMNMGLHHRNLLTVDSYSTWESRPYLVMALCREGSVGKKAGNLSEREIWQFIRDVAAGIEYLHSLEEPIVHQDIKPDNVLIADDGRFVITDFGISKRLRNTMHRASMIASGAGATAYMGPERFSSDTTPVMASDIWSLGASIYELCTGELPFAGMGGGMQKNGAELPVLGSNWSRQLNDVMQACLAKEPWNRPTAARLVEFSTAMLEALEGRRGMPRWVPTHTASQPTVMDKATTGSQPTIATGFTSPPAPPTSKSNALPWVLGGIVVALLIAIPIIILAVRNTSATEKVADIPTVADEDTDIVEVVEEVDFGPVDSTGCVSAQLPPAPMSHSFTIHEGFYYANYNCFAEEGSLTVTQTIAGNTETYTLRTNSNADLEKILDQFEGLAYFWAATDVGSYIINENGSYSEEYLQKTINLLSKSEKAFSRGGAPMAYDGAKSRKDMLTKILRNPDGDNYNEIDMIIWGMGEHPVETKDIKLE